LQKRPVTGAYYWYVDREDVPKEVPLPDAKEAEEAVLSVALKVKDAREKNEFACPSGGCFACEPFEKILRGEAKFIGVGDYQDLYLI